MFRVPCDPDEPAFCAAFAVPFTRWLGASREERCEWKRRRKVASTLARVNRREAARARRAERRGWADAEARRNQRRTAVRAVLRQEISYWESGRR